MKHRGTKFLSLLLTLVMVVGLMPGMGLTTYADNTETLLTTITPTGKTTHSATVDGVVTVSHNNDFYDGTYGWLWHDAAGTLTVSGCEGYTITKVIFKQNAKSPFTDSSAPFELHFDLMEWGIVCQENYGFDGVTSIDVYGYASTVAVTNVTLTPTSATLSVDGVQKLTATVSPADATDKKVKWSVGGTNSGAVTLYSDAACTAPLALNTAIDTLTVYAKGTAAGSATVTVTSNADATKSASCAVTVSAVTYTVTYDPGRGSGTMEPTTVSKNAAEKYMYTVESCGFTAPEGETFAYWLGSDRKTYRPGPEVEISANLTLTAQWKKSGSDGGDSDGGSGGGFDLVFNIPGEDNSWEYVGGGYAPQQAYRVSLTPMQGGSAALGLTTGESGVQMNVYPTTTVYVFPNAAQGYVLDKIVWSLIDGSASYDITEAKNFVMPAMDVVVYVTFKPLAS